jgi:hypothetical protein
MAPESCEGRSAQGWVFEDWDMVRSEVFWRLGRGIVGGDGGAMEVYIGEGYGMACQWLRNDVPGSGYSKRGEM